ncbi:MAG: hypothetical protein PHY47_00920 [Lachnospiraceae bacterium]|nr:hypothetical protein [Lachnospiraceae bacterium]
MAITDINVGFNYKKSSFVPNESLKTPRSIRSNYLIMRFEDLDEHKLIKDTQERYLEYYDSASKRVGFSAMKTILRTIKVGQETGGFKYGGWTNVEAVIRAWSETFGLPIDGLLAIQTIKNLIQNTLFNELNLSSPNLRIEIEDIERGSEYSKVRLYSGRLGQVKNEDSENGGNNGQIIGNRRRR